MAGGIEEDERHVRVAQKQRMDQPVVALARQIPENCLALCAVGLRRAQPVQQPELLPVSGGMFLELVMRQTPSQAGFAHPGVADQHDLRAGVGDRVRRAGLRQECVEIQLVEMDDAVSQPNRRVRVRTHRRKDG